MLGIILGSGRESRARQSHASSLRPAISDLGAWLEQLLAESTGKAGQGNHPRRSRRAGRARSSTATTAYSLTCVSRTRPDAQQDAKVAALEKAGHPVVRIAVDDTYDLGQEFFRWEIATAVAGSIIGINAFNQPDVEASKIDTRKL